MADQLCTVADLSSVLERTDIDTTKATVLIETGTSIVQEAAGGQRIVQVIGDQVAMEGVTDSWLALPQLPVTAVTSVVLDGTTLLTANNDYKVVGNRLWRRLGWQTNWGWPIDWPYPVWGINGTPFNWQGMLSEPSVAVTTYTHGYAPGAQQLQLGRAAVLSMIAGAYSNPQALKAESIDDYSVTYAALSGQLTDSMRASIRRQYGRRAGFVRAG